MKLIRGVLASSIVVALLVPAVAHAGTVSVEEIPGSINAATLRFTAAPGETNQVTISGGSASAGGGLVSVTVVDKGAPLQAGAGCSGGGAAGEAATCAIHPPRGPEFTACGRDCYYGTPGTAWRDQMVVELGDGDDSFDGSSFTGELTEAWAMQVNGGAGNDTISTGGGNDTIVPGPGNDVVHSNGGLDRAIADATPDGNDVLNLGTGTYNVVDDSARTEPLRLEHGILGGPGEADLLEGLNMVIGGSGNDYFVSAGSESLKGGPGDDTLIGSEAGNYIYGGDGNDTIRGEAGDDHVFGGEGNDNIEGGAGNDIIEERGEEEDAETVFGSTLAAVGGNDTINGGEGNDLILAGPGDDVVEGGPGNDRIFGEAGNDKLNGGSGDDEIAGEAGADALSGGEGNDLLLAGRLEEFNSTYLKASPVDTSTDQVDCGPGTDIAQSNGWDDVSNCETHKTIRAVRIGKIARDRGKGSARVTYSVGGTGSLRVAGKGVHPVSRPIPGSGATEPTAYSGAVAVRTTGATLAKLRRQGHVTVTLRLSWTPTGQTQVTETRRLKLVLKRPGVASSASSS